MHQWKGWDSQNRNNMWNFSKLRREYSTMVADHRGASQRLVYPAETLYNQKESAWLLEAA